MDALGLPVLAQNVEFSSIPPIETSRILNYFNQFVTSTVHVLNKFAVISDSKLANLDFRLQDVEATLAILEEKLASIPTASPETTNLPSLLPTMAESVPIPPPLPAQKEQQGPDVTVSHQKAVESTSHPEIPRFTKMLAVGVPQLAVEQKMRAEGYDPALLSAYTALSTNQTSSSSDVTLQDTDNSED